MDSSDSLFELDASSSDSGEQCGVEDSDQSKYITEYTESSLPDINGLKINDDEENQSRSFAFDTSDEENDNEVKASGGVCPNETLELLEYVPKNGKLNYELVKNREESGNSFDNDKEMLLIGSSSEASFTTSQTNEDFKSITTTNTSFATAPEVNMTARSWSSSENTDDVPNSSENSSADTQSHSSSSTDIDPLPPYENLSNSYDSIPDFDSTLERTEYLIEMGQKLQAKTAATAKLRIKEEPVDVTPQKTADTPKLSIKVELVDATPQKSSPVETSRLPQPNRIPICSQKMTPVAVKPPASRCMKPENISSPSTLRSKPPIPKSASKIPILKVPSSLSKPQFQHIASPLASYIKNSPRTPFFKTIRLTKQPFDPNLGGRSPHERDPSVQASFVSNKKTFSPKLSLPKKVFKAASSREVSRIEPPHI